MNFYFYKMTSDNGGAPCCTFAAKPLWSLAICKPRIRTRAGQGDIVLGFAGLKLDPQRGYGLVHVARVTQPPLPGREYYGAGSAYRDRDDCIYEWNGKDYRLRNERFHNEDDKDRDLGSAPERGSAWVLLGTDFRYFGRDRLRIDWARFPALRNRLELLQQGHRVNHAPEVRGELEALVTGAFHQDLASHDPQDRVSRCGPGDDDEEGCS
jgi:hypothetical protein